MNEPRPHHPLLARAALLAVTLPLLATAAIGCPHESRLGNDSNFATALQALNAAEIDDILVEAALQADAAGVNAAVAITDREGEVLGAFVMNVAGRDALAAGNLGAAISKAGTASFFQSEQNAFTTRSAFFIVQGNFPPGVRNSDGGPLFGVQDSSLALSDSHPLAFDQNGNAVGAGISGQLGGIPLYKNGAPVGGLGVDTADVLFQFAQDITDGTQTLISPVQNELDEEIAVSAAASLGFEAPGVIRSTNAFVDGFALPFVETFARAPLRAAGQADVGDATIVALGALDPTFPIVPSQLNAEDRVNGQFGVRNQNRLRSRRVAALADTDLAVVTSDVALTIGGDTSIFDSANYVLQTVPIANLTQATLTVPGEVRFGSINSLEPAIGANGLTAAEVDLILATGAARANRASAGIRLPRGSGVRVHIVVCDARGNILGTFRMGDGTLFSFDIAVQKARTCAFFSTNDLAVTPRSFGFLAQPFFPPGIDGTAPGALVRLRDLVNRGQIPVETIPSFSLINPPPRPPSDGTTDEDILTPGLQGFDDFAGAAPATLNAARAIVASVGLCPLADVEITGSNDFISPGLQSGIQTFPGGVPIYRNGVLIGGVGVSGDGVDEDDLVAFTAGSLFPPPPGIRIDEASEATIITRLSQQVNALRDAILAHPDPKIRDVYGPIFTTEAAAVAAALANGLNGVRIPFVKLPRNPDER